MRPRRRAYVTSKEKRQACSVPLLPRMKVSPYFFFSWPLTYSSVCSRAMFMYPSKHANLPVPVESATTWCEPRAGQHNTGGDTSVHRRAMLMSAERRSWTTSVVDTRVQLDNDLLADNVPQEVVWCLFLRHRGGAKVLLQHPRRRKEALFARVKPACDEAQTSRHVSSFLAVTANSVSCRAQQRMGRAPRNTGKCRSDSGCRHSAPCCQRAQKPATSVQSAGWHVRNLSQASLSQCKRDDDAIDGHAQAPCVQA